MSQDDIQRDNDAGFEEDLGDVDQQPDTTGMRPDQSSEGDN